MRQSAGHDGSAVTQPGRSKRGSSRLSRMGALACAILAILAMTPVALLLIDNGQLHAGGWGVRWLPSNHPWVGQGHGIRVVEEEISSGLGGYAWSNGTYITHPPGLVHTQLKQWGRLQWWHNDVVKDPGKYSEGDVQALTQEVMAATGQRARSSVKR